MSFPEPVRVGSYGTIFYGDGVGHTGRVHLKKNVNKLHDELHHKSVADAIQPKRPDSFNKYARQVGRLYGIGTDSPVVAHALIAENYSEIHPKDEGTIGVRRSALEMVLEGEGIEGSSDKADKNDGNRMKKGGISRAFPTEETKSMSSYDRFGDVSPVHSKKAVSKHDTNIWNKKGAQPMTITESLYLSERMEGGKWHIHEDKKKDDYTAPMVSAAAGELGNSITTTPKSWPKSVEYTKSISRPHPEIDERFRKGVIEKACSKSKLGSMRAFNKANSGSIYDSGSGFINPLANNIKQNVGQNKKRSARNKDQRQHQQEHKRVDQRNYPQGQGPVDDASLLSFEASYLGNDGYGGSFYSIGGGEEEEVGTLGGSISSPVLRGHESSGDKYTVTFDKEMYESAQRRDDRMLAEISEINQNSSKSNAKPGVGSVDHLARQKEEGSLEQRAPAGAVSALVLEHDDDVDEHIANQMAMHNTNDILGDVLVDEIYTQGDAQIIAGSDAGRANTAGEVSPGRQMHQEQNHQANDHSVGLTSSRTVKESPSNGDKQHMPSMHRVYAVDYGNDKDGLVVQRNRDMMSKRDDRRGAISVSPSRKHRTNEFPTGALENGATWIHAVGADQPSPGGRVVGYEYRREKYDEKGQPLEGSYHRKNHVYDDGDTDEHSVGSYRSLGSLPQFQQPGDSTVQSEMSGLDSKFDSRDLVCGKLKKVEKNSATRILMEKSVKRGIRHAQKTVKEHASMLLAGPGGISKNRKQKVDQARTLVDGAYIDDATIDSQSIQLSTHQDMILNIPGNMTTGADNPGSDTISRIKHEFGKKDSPNHRERGGEHAQPHDKRMLDIAGLGNTAAGRFKMKFVSTPGNGAADASTLADPVLKDTASPSSTTKEREHFNALQPEHMRWSKLAGEGIPGKGGQPDLTTRREKILQMYGERKAARRLAKQERKQKRQADANARWHARLEEKKKARIAAGLDSDDENDMEEWSDEEIVVTSDEDEQELIDEEKRMAEALMKAELSALPHDNRYDKDGNLIVTTKMTVNSLIGKGPATGQEGSPEARERNRRNIAARRETGKKAGGKPLPGSDITFYNPENNRSYSDQLNQHLEVPTEKISGNPFRPTERQIGRMGAKSVTKIPEPKDVNPLEYRAEATHRKAGRYGIIIKADKTVRGAVPTRNEIQTALSKASRKNLLAYDTRIVETGALLKALNHHQHSTPGIPAIVSLHKAFVTAAAMNPNPWLLKRDQVAAVIQDNLPWMDGGSLRRLVSAYDPHGSGLIKYVKISAALVCASKPSMANLIVLLSRLEEERQEKARKQAEAEREWDLAQAKNAATKGKAEGHYKHTSTDSHSHIHDPGTEPLPSGKPRDDESVVSSTSTYKGDYGCEKYILKLMHGLYEDCEGTNTGRILKNNDRLLPPRTLAAPGCGIRIEDIVELVSVCACNVEDELVMQSVMTPVVQAVYQAGRAKDSVLSDYDQEQQRLADEERAEQIMLEREAKMRELNQGKGGGNPHADDVSSNFTARSGFTPHIMNTDSYTTSGMQKGTIYDPGIKRAAPGSRYGAGYQPRWPNHARSGSTSMTRDPQDRFSGTGMHGASARQVTNFMNRSRASDEENALWLKAKEKEGYDRKQQRGLHAKRKDVGSVILGGDSVAWDDDSLAASSLASGGAVTAAAGASVTAGGNMQPKKVIKGGRRAVTADVFNANQGTESFTTDTSASRHLPDGRLAATHALKYQSIKSSLHVPRVGQSTFIDCMVNDSTAIETFVKQLDKFRKALNPYVLGGTISYEQSILDDTSYGTRIPHSK